MSLDAAALFRRAAHSHMKLLDQVLAGRDFIAGPRYSMADAFALSALDFGAAYNSFSIPEKRKNLLRWHRVVSSRPSAGA
jgi:glutathione S-transferase